MQGIGDLDLRHRHLAPGEVAVKAAAQRLRPVFLTTATTILGLLPLALGVSVDMVGRDVVVNGVIASFWVKLASAIVYGLSFSTLLTLIVTPVMLVLPSTLRDGIQGMLPGIRGKLGLDGR